MKWTLNSVGQIAAVPWGFNLLGLGNLGGGYSAPLIARPVRPRGERWRGSAGRTPPLFRNHEADVLRPDDQVVNIEHYYRMQTMLELFGKSHESYLIEGGRHSPTGPQWVDFANRLREFLMRHLDVRG
jgi:hypothetical protein